MGFPHPQTCFFPRKLSCIMIQRPDGLRLSSVPNAVSVLHCGLRVFKKPRSHWTLHLTNIQNKNNSNSWLRCSYTLVSTNRMMTTCSSTGYADHGFLGSAVDHVPTRFQFFLMMTLPFWPDPVHEYALYYRFKYLVTSKPARIQGQNHCFVQSDSL